MTNEELAERIQAGENELMEVLWQGVERLVAWQARRVLTVLDGYGGVEFGDLYDAGYIALVRAVENFRPGEGAFSTWLMFFLRTEFAQTAGYRTKRQRKDPLQNYVSLSTPLGEEDGDVLEDVLPDPRSEEPFGTVEEQQYRSQLRDVLDSMLAELPEQQQEIIQKRYFEQCSRMALGQRFGLSMQRVAQIEEIALSTLREPPFIYRLEEFIDSKTPYYLSVSARDFQRTRTSAVEKIVLLRERWRTLMTRSNNNERKEKNQTVPRLISGGSSPDRSIGEFREESG